MGTVGLDKLERGTNLLRAGRDRTRMGADQTAQFVPVKGPGPVWADAKSPRFGKMVGDAAGIASVGGRQGRQGREALPRERERLSCFCSHLETSFFVRRIVRHGSGREG